ncbi:MAG: hypothetical protein K2W95_01945 [Candidatus Obscuribacterales bacterium]|nr:hypothetical protein [Candidatus Obscuribacterales bacterium]
MSNCSSEIGENLSEQVSIYDDSAVVSGPEKFMFGQTCAIPIDSGLTAVSRIVEPFFSRLHAANKTFLEIEGCSIFHSLRALEAGASSSVIVDGSGALQDQVRTARGKFSLSRLHSIKLPVQQIRTRFDRVLVLSSADDHAKLIEQSGGVSGLVLKLAQLTRGFCILGWRLTEQSADVTHEPQIFELLEKYFAKVDVIGRTENIVIFVAFASREVFLLGDELTGAKTDAPLAMTKVIRRKDLCKSHVVRAFDCSDHWLKQYNTTEALRTEQIVRSLPAGAAPAILDVGTEAESSYICIEKVETFTMDSLRRALDTDEKYLRFAVSLLLSLESLRDRGFIQRSVGLDNVTLRSGQVVFYEFDSIDDYDPHACGAPDLRSGGELLRSVNAGRFMRFHKIEELMLADPVRENRLSPSDFIALIALIDSSSLAESSDKQLLDLLAKLLSVTYEFNQCIRQRQCLVESQLHEIDQTKIRIDLQSKLLEEVRAMAEAVLCKVERLEIEQRQILQSRSWRIAVTLQKLNQQMRTPLRLLSSKLSVVR